MFIHNIHVKIYLLSPATLSNSMIVTRLYAIQQQLGWLTFGHC